MLFNAVYNYLNTLPTELDKTLYLLLSFEGVLGKRSEMTVCFGILGFLCVHWCIVASGTGGGSEGRKSFERLEAILEPITGGWNMNSLPDCWLTSASIC